MTLARAELELGHLYLDRNMSKEARTYLETSRATFEQLGAKTYTQRADEALSAMV